MKILFLKTETEKFRAKFQTKKNHNSNRNELSPMANLVSANKRPLDSPIWRFVLGIKSCGIAFCSVNKPKGNKRIEETFQVLLLALIDFLTSDTIMRNAFFFSSRLLWMLFQCEIRWTRIIKKDRTPKCLPVTALTKWEFLFFLFFAQQITL